MQIKKLEEYCKKMLLKYEIDSSYINISDKIYKVVGDGERVLFDEDMVFIAGEDFDDNCDGYVFEFIGRWYYKGIDSNDILDFKYIGEPNVKIPTNSFLGIRSGYELMNGMGSYDQWIEKAKFLGIKNLGICERNTLSGVLSFQKLCKKNNIKSITGMTISVLGESSYDIKVYAKNFQGWQSMLLFNKILNVDGDKGVDENTLISNSKDLFIIGDPKSLEYGSSIVKSGIIDFYQLDTVRFLNEERDSEYLNTLEKWIMGSVPPISITDAFYLEKEEWQTREKLWAINKAFDDKTDNQYFKSKNEYASELIVMFDSENKSWVKLFKNAIASEKEVVENCDFMYDVDTRHLPRYEMTNEESKKYKDNEHMFLELIKDGLKEKGVLENKNYIERLKVEIDILKKGDVIDYFLSLYDIIGYARSKGMLTGIGRGSAGGSLVAYLLGIIHLDPLDFDLLFERFLNSGRMGEWVERPLIEVECDNGKVIKLPEGSIVKIKRNDREVNVYCHQLEDGDEILKY